MATQKHTVQSHLTVFNVVDRMIHNPVGNPEIPQLNVSFAAEAILLKAAPYIAVKLNAEYKSPAAIIAILPPIST
jgi:hypothetical protein